MDQKQGTKANPIAFDHESPEHAENWPDEFREMREKCPVAWTDRHGGYWVATSYDAVVEMARDPETFSSAKSFDPETASGSGGITIPFMEDDAVRLLAVEPTSCPTLTQGRFEYDFGDTAGLTPLMPMYTLGHDFMPPSIHAGGLRDHGDSPIISALVKAGRMEAVAAPQSKVFEAATLFARTEGKLPAPETGHAIRAAIDEALAAKETGEEKVILFNYSGHGFLDLAAYDAYNHGTLIDE